MTEAPGERGEQATRFDLGELLRVADEDQLRPRPGGVADEAMELAGANHSGLVEDQHVRSGTAGPGPSRSNAAIVWLGMPDPD